MLVTVTYHNDCFQTYWDTVLYDTKNSVLTKVMCSEYPTTNQKCRRLKKQKLEAYYKSSGSTLTEEPVEYHWKTKRRP